MLAHLDLPGSPRESFFSDRKGKYIYAAITAENEDEYNMSTILKTANDEHEQEFLCMRKEQFSDFNASNVFIEFGLMPEKVHFFIFVQNLLLHHTLSKHHQVCIFGSCFLSGR